MPIIFWAEQYYPKYDSWIGSGNFARSKEAALRDISHMKESNEEYGIKKVTEYRVRAAYLTMEDAIQGGYARKDETIWYRNNDEHNSVMSEVA